MLPQHVELVGEAERQLERGGELLDGVETPEQRGPILGGVVQDVVVSPDGQTLYAANEAGWLDVIHLPSGRCTATVELGTPALGVGLSADASHLFVGLLDAGRVLVLQRQGLVERASVAVGGRPRLIATHPDGDAVLVANEAGWVDLLR